MTTFISTNGNGTFKFFVETSDASGNLINFTAPLLYGVGTLACPGGP